VYWYDWYDPSLLVHPLALMHPCLILVAPSPLSHLTSASILALTSEILFPRATGLKMDLTIVFKVDSNLAFHVGLEISPSNNFLAGAPPLDQALLTK